MSHVTCLNELYQTYEWVVSHIWMRYVAHMNEAHLAHEGVMWHMVESCHTFEWFISHTWMSHSTHMHEARHTYGCRCSVCCSVYCSVVLQCVLQRVWAIVFRDISVWSTWMLHIHESQHESWHTWMSHVIHIYDTIHPYVTWRIHVCDTSHSHNMTWLNHLCDVTRSLVWFEYTCKITRCSFLERLAHISLAFVS